VIDRDVGRRRHVLDAGDRPHPASAKFARRAAVMVRTGSSMPCTRTSPERKTIVATADAYLVRHRNELFIEAKEIAERWHAEGRFGM